MRKWLSLVLSLVLALGLCVPAMAAEELTEPDAPVPAEEAAPEQPEEAMPEVPEAAMADVSEETPADQPEQVIAPPAAADEPAAASVGSCGANVLWRRDA